ncbi:MAG: FecR domain-containing protein [Spirochaetes bacterium]|nr:FecR domain-containing protein [Spirochaetota bacterium]
MKSLSSNAIVFIVGAIIIAIFSFLFYLDINKRIAIGEAKIIGTVTFKKRVAQRRYSRQVVWEDLETTEPIYNNDTIRTGDKSEAVVKIHDGTEFTLNENSMVLLSFGGEGLDLEFTQGSLTAKRDEISGKPFGKVRIKSGDASVVFEKSTVNISKEKGESLKLVVDKGTAVVQTASGEKIVGENDKATVLLKTASVSVEKQKIVLLSPPSGSILTTKEAKNAITFRWKHLPDQGTYVIDIEPVDVGQGGKISRKTEEDTMEIPLSTGSYKWRVRYRSKDGSHEETSEIRTLMILPHDSIITISPTENSVYYYKNKPPLVHFKWEQLPSSAHYVLSVFRDRELSSKFMEIQTISPAVLLDSLPEGQWFWKVDAFSGISGVGSIGSSEVRSLRIVKRTAIPPPELLLPLPGMRFWQKAIAKKPIRFSWRNDPEIISSEIVISQDEEFKKIYHRETKKTSSFILAKDIQNGNYYWKVRGMVDEATYTEYSPVWNFRISDDVLLELLSPADRQIFVPMDDEESIKVRFSWKRIDFDGLFTLQVARDKDFKKIVVQKTEKNFTIEVPELQRGEYYWRVVLNEESGSELVKSQHRSFVIEERLRAPVAIFPLNNSTVDMSDKKSISFRWLPVVGADLYNIELFMVKDGREYRIINRNTKVPTYEMEELFRLDEAKFLWTVRAYDIHEGKILRTSPFTKNYFNIVLSKKMKKPVIRVPKIIFAE